MARDYGQSKGSVVNSMYKTWTGRKQLTTWAPLLGRPEI